MCTRRHYQASTWLSQIAVYSYHLRDIKNNYDHGCIIIVFVD